ncbi:MULTISPECIES: ABC transporter permease [unclassified Nocardioides]|uniref:ABC transporter permease n=1 Tax=unclassified Nocardioides TaxID=2615069 RepID=UPI0026666191|nr:ABC transporter permease [Nocardioides sp. Arc9.136]WKN46762.1 ABC transporter permease [Nocardioides sp. Arc9.136]
MDTTTAVAGVPAGARLQQASPPRRRRRAPLHLLRRWVSPVALVALWQLASSTGVLDERKLASPAQVATTALDLVQAGTLGTQTLISLQRVGLGFAIGATIGLALAVVAGLSRVGEDAIDPPMQMLRTLPHFGLVTLFIIWFGIGETPKVALIALGATFPLYLNTLGGIRGIERKTLEAAQALHLTWAQRIRHVVIPGALPQTLVGLRQSLGIAWLSLIVAETIASQSGLGYMINHAKDFLQTDVIVVGLAVYSLLGLATDAVVRYLERKALAWRS